MQMRVLVVLFVAACGRPTASSNLNVTTEVSTAEVRRGDSVFVTVTVRNAGESTARINPDPCPSFVVTTSAGVVVGPAEIACKLSLETKDLAPGESFTIVSRWAGDASAGTIKSPPDMLSPGTYLVRGRIISSDVGFVESQPLSVRIVP
jgi:hypothetical protein